MRISTYRFITIFSLGMLSSLALPKSLAQPAGVNPLGGSDATTAELAHGVKSAETVVWSVDFSHRTLVKSSQSSHTVDDFDRDGNLLIRQSIDSDNQLDSRVVFQYTDDGRKRVSTTYSKGDRSLQTLYAYTADGCLARMRFTDADAVTISTTEVSTTESYTVTLEQFNDSEKVRTTYYYDKNLHLTKVVRDNGLSTSDVSYALSYDGLPARASRVFSDGTRQTLTFSHDVDDHGNWTRRVTYVDGVAVELAERTIQYWE